MQEVDGPGKLVILIRLRRLQLRLVDRRRLRDDELRPRPNGLRRPDDSFWKDLELLGWAREIGILEYWNDGVPECWVN